MTSDDLRLFYAEWAAKSDVVRDRSKPVAERLAALHWIDAVIGEEPTPADQLEDVATEMEGFLNGEASYEDSFPTGAVTRQEIAGWLDADPTRLNDALCRDYAREYGDIMAMGYSEEQEDEALGNLADIYIERLNREESSNG